MSAEKQKNLTLIGFMLMLALTLVLTVGCEPDDDDDVGGDEPPIVIDTTDNFCLEDITDLRPGQGPFSSRQETLRVSGGQVKVWVPQNVPSGCKLPIVHLANGTTARCSMYGSILTNLAEFGFIAACYEDPNTGQAHQAITAIEAAMGEYANIADTGKIGFTGHSQGGGATYVGVYRAEQKWGNSKIYSGLAMQPASGFGDAPRNWEDLYGQIESPMSMFNGTSDTLVAASWVRSAYNALSNDIFKIWYTATGRDSTHIPTPNNPTQEMSIPWFRWTLLGDSNACQDFKDLPNVGDWRHQQSVHVPMCN